MNTPTENTVYFTVDSLKEAERRAKVLRKGGYEVSFFLKEFSITEHSTPNAFGALRYYQPNCKVKVDFIEKNNGRVHLTNGVCVYVPDGRKKLNKKGLFIVFATKPAKERSLQDATVAATNCPGGGRLVNTIDGWQWQSYEEAVAEAAEAVTIEVPKAPSVFEGLSAFHYC